MMFGACIVVTAMIAGSLGYWIGFDRGEWYAHRCNEEDDEGQEVES